MFEDFSQYMNAPECPVEIGKSYYRKDMLGGDTVYKVVDIKVKNEKYYAVCEYRDAFDGSLVTGEVYAYYLVEI